MNVDEEDTETETSYHKYVPFPSHPSPHATRVIFHRRLQLRREANLWLAAR